MSSSDGVVSIVRAKIFDADRLDEALARFEELASPAASDEQYGAKFNVQLVDDDVARQMDRFVGALRSHDWDALADIYTQDVVRIDQRAGLRSENFGREAIIASHMELADLGLDQIALTPIGVRGRSLLLVQATLTHRDDYVVEMLILLDLDDDLRVKARVSFDLDDLDEAFAELDRRFLENTERPAPTSELTNASTRHFEQMLQAIYDEDWDAYGAAMTDDVLFEDRRAGLGVRTVGREAALEQGRFVASLRPRVTHETIATRGDRLAMKRIEWHDLTPDSGFSARAIWVDEVDADGRLSAVVSFDWDDEDAAFDELDERYGRGEGAPFEPFLRAAVEYIKANAAADWERVREFLHEDWVMVDHRLASLGTIVDRDAFVSMQRSFQGQMEERKTPSRRGSSPLRRTSLRPRSSRGPSSMVPRSSSRSSASTSSETD